MRQARRRTAAGLAIPVALATIATAWLLVLTGLASAQFTDTPNWARDEINWLAANHIARGYPDDSFRPNENITRAQAAFWFANYNNTIQVVTQTVTDLGGQSYTTNFAECPAGTRAIAGGGDTNQFGLHMSESYPGPVGANSGWFVTWETWDGAIISGLRVDVHALCIPDLVSR